MTPDDHAGEDELVRANLHGLGGQVQVGTDQLILAAGAVGRHS